MKKHENRLIVIAVVMSFFYPTLRCETLGDVLSARRLPQRILSVADRKIPAWQAVWSTHSEPFLLAYYDDVSVRLPRVLHVLRYDERTRDLRRVDLHGTNVRFQGFDNIMDNPSNDCMGAALAISEADGFITIDTHVNPSAGCILILTADLKFSAALYGWVLGRVEQEIIVEESMVHFAAVHDGHLALYNPRDKRLTPIYPSNTDVNRIRFSAELTHHLPPAAWCAQQNNACDPSIFTSDIDHVVVDVRRLEFAFDVLMTAEGFGAEAERLVQPRTIHYICEKTAAEWQLSSGLPTHDRP